MPELPEVETIVQGLRRTVIGKRIKSAYADRCRIFTQRDFCKNLAGKKIKSVRRRGKFIVMELSDGYHLLIHLGMTGGLFHYKKNEPGDKHDHLTINFTDNKTQLRYNDQRKFGKIKKSKIEKEKFKISLKNIPDLAKLGCEPLEITSDEFAELFKKRKGRIKPLLMNQRFLAGLGNIYSDEALFGARIHPLTPAHRISKQKLKKLHRAIQRILKKAILAGGSSVDSYTNLEGERGFFQLAHKVYAREGEKCKRCGTKIKRIRITQRSTHYCPKCQKIY